MKMQEVNIELLAFDSTDVIATSGVIEVNDDSTAIIWLTRQSIINYNNFTKDDINLHLDAVEKQFYAFSGIVSTSLIDIPGFGEYTLQEYSVSGSSDDPPSEFNVMNDGDRSMYQYISKWLADHKN